MGKKKLSSGKVFRNMFYILAIIWGILTPILLVASIVFALIGIQSSGDMDLFIQTYGFFGLIGLWQMQFIYWIVSLFGTDMATALSGVFVIILFILYLIPITGVFSGIRCWKDRRYDSVVASNAAMVVGLIAINPFLIIGGFINHRVYIANNKYMPDGKARLG